MSHPRARGARIRYRIVDEYGGRLHRYFASSDSPLTLGEMIEQIEGSEYPEYCRGLVLGAIDAGLKVGSDPKSLATFYEVSSDFYDELPDYFARAAASRFRPVRIGLAVPQPAGTRSKSGMRRPARWQ